MQAGQRTHAGALPSAEGGRRNLRRHRVGAGSTS